MATKIFVSYKYADTSVYQDPKLNKIFVECKNVWAVTPRSYLNKLEYILDDYVVQKWEKDNEDLSLFKEITIEEKLKEKIYDSSATIVLISPNMKNMYESENTQWIPWEVSYSLKEVSRNDRTSRTNAMIALILPDKNGLYDYCVEDTGCAKQLKFSNGFCFDIIARNFFNKIDLNMQLCETCGNVHYIGDDNHYFIWAKWNDFIMNPKRYIEEAKLHQIHIDDYKIHKTVI